MCSSCKLLRLCLVRLWKSSAGSINLTRQAADQITRQEGKGQQLLVYRKPEHGKESFRKLRMQTGRVSPIYYYYWCSLLKKILIYNLQLKVAALSVPMRHGKYFQCAGGEDDLTCPGGFLDEARRRPLVHRRAPPWPWPCGSRRDAETVPRWSWRKNTRKSGRDRKVTETLSYSLSGTRHTSQRCCFNY